MRVVERYRASEATFRFHGGQQHPAGYARCPAGQQRCTPAAAARARAAVSTQCGTLGTGQRARACGAAHRVGLRTGRASSNDQLLLLCCVFLTHPHPHPTRRPAATAHPVPVPRWGRTGPLPARRNGALVPLGCVYSRAELSGRCPRAGWFVGVVSNPMAGLLHAFFGLFCPLLARFHSHALLSRLRVRMC